MRIGLGTGRGRASGLGFLAVVALASLAQAGERHFAFLREVPVHAPGEWEYEQFITWSKDKDADSDFDEFKFRHEIEIGVVENLQIGIYLADWRYRDGKSVTDDGVDYQTSGIEVIYQLTDPTVDPIGLGLYGEFLLGPEKIKLEPKLLVQKNIDKWVLAYNFVFEAEWEGQHLGDLDERKGEIKHLVAASYLFDANWSFGGELVHEIEFPDYEDAEDSVVYLGPNITYRRSGWFITVTPLFQVTDEPGAANFQTRMVIGIDF